MNVRNSFKKLLYSNEYARKCLHMRRLLRSGTMNGWLRSVDAGLPVDEDGQPIPWYTYSSISFLSGRVKDNMRVFEYGSGNSTRWWGKRVLGVVACEHDRKWYEMLKKTLPDHVDYRYCPLDYGGKYCAQVGEFKSEFDCVIIDGRDRVNCARIAIPALNPRGVIIWDNSERSHYGEGLDFLEASGFRRIDFSGIGPINCYPWTTSVFYRSDNCLCI